MSTESHERYNFADGDLTLLTNDGVKFRVHSAVLKAGSRVFRDMLELASPNAHNPNEPISLSEDSKVLETVFEFLYPSDALELPKPTTFKDAMSLCEIAEKYDMPLALAGMRSVILGAKELYGDGIDVYVFACKRGWHDVADVASTATLIVELSEESVMKKLEALDGPGLHKLFRLHMTRKKQIVDSIQVVKDDDENGPHYPFPIPSALSCMCYGTDMGVIEEPIRVLETLRETAYGALTRRPLGDDISRIFSYDMFNRLDIYHCRRCEKKTFDETSIVIEVTKAVDTAVRRISDLKD